jgi:hypothetical protein
MLLDPTGQASAQKVTLAPRPVSLRGCRLGLLDNTKPNARRLLDEVGALLAAEFGVASVVRRSKPTMSLPGPDTLLDEMARECDAVVVAVGD